MTQTEIKNKIADWENRLKNPSVASVPSAVAKIEGQIADLKSKLEEEKPKIEKKEKIAKEPKDSNIEKEAINKTKSKYKVGQEVEYKYEGSDASGEIVLVSYDDEVKTFAYFFDDKKFKRELPIIIYEKDIIGLVKKHKIESKENKKEETKKQPYDCDELIKEAKERHAKAKKVAKERAEAPKKSEATKDKEKIAKVHHAIEKQVESGKLSRGQIKKLIDETKDLLKLLEKALNNL